MPLMKDKKPILYILGIPGQFYTAQALSRQFGHPVVGLTNYARVEEKLTPETRAIFSDIISFPDFYFSQKSRLDSMAREDRDKQIHTLEKKIGIENNAMLVHYDRALRWMSDHDRVRIFQLATLEFANDVLTRLQPAFVIDGVATYLQLVLRSGCRKNDIPCLLTQNSRLNGHFNMLHDNGHHVGMQQVFDELQKGHFNAINADEKEAADKLFYEFVDRPKRPAYAEKNSVLKPDFRKLLRKISYTLAPDQLFPSEGVRKLDRAMNYEAIPLLSLQNGLRGKVRRFEQKIKRVFEDNPELNRPFIYLPLHYTPEVSDMYFGTDYDHHAGFVSQLAKHIPSYCQLYVKEHTSMLGRRPTSFYEELNALCNVRMISPAVDTFTLARESVAVATVTGTAGWEAHLLGKPVIALGNVFYNFLPNVFHSVINPGFEAALKQYLERFKDDETARLNAFRAFYVTCCKGTKGDIGPDITFNQVHDNAAMFAKSMHGHIQKWHSIIGGTFPADLVDVPTTEKKRAQIA